MNEEPDFLGLNLADLQARIRDQAARKQAAIEAGVHTAQGLGGPAFNWLQVHCRLNAAERLAQADDSVPHLWRFPGPLRHLARLLGRLFLYAAQLVTVRQGQFNRSLLQTLREAGEGLRNLEVQVCQQEERLRDLERALDRIDARARQRRIG